jgi:hypothetical protein
MLGALLLSLPANGRVVFSLSGVQAQRARQRSLQQSVEWLLVVLRRRLGPCS